MHNSNGYPPPHQGFDLAEIDWAEVSPQVAAASFPATAASVPQARAWTCQMLLKYGCPQDSGTATLLAGELATTPPNMR